MFIIESERLQFRDLDDDDLHDMFRLGNNPDITKYMDYIVFESEKNARHWLLDKIQHNRTVPRESYNLAIIEKSTSQFVGWIGIGGTDNPEKGDLDFGYAIAKEQWGKGYATEALKTVIDYCFQNHEVKQITGECDARNVGSMRVMEKVGMSEIKRFNEQNGECTVRYRIERTA